jgi:AcrR family transcriptional regulator
VSSTGYSASNGAADGSPSLIGRPRDPSVEDRVYSAAVALYDEEGWSGFTLDAVAALAKVGKSTIYRRWGTKEELISDALAARTSDVTRVDTGSFRGDLVQLVVQMLDNYTAAHGLVSLRLFVEAPRNAVLESRLEARLVEHSRGFDDIFERARSRGELKDAGHDRNIREAIGGSTLHRVITTPPSVRTALRRDRRAVGEEIVDFVLGALGVSA